MAPVVNACPAMDHGSLRHDHPDVRPGQLAAVQDAERLASAARRREPPIAERVLPADVEGKVVAHPVPFAGEKWNQAAEVVIVPVAEDEGVHRGQIDLGEIMIRQRLTDGFSCGLSRFNPCWMKTSEVTDLEP